MVWLINAGMFPRGEEGMSLEGVVVRECQSVAAQEREDII